METIPREAALAHEMAQARRNAPGAVLRLMRPLQWYKNALVTLALIFARRLGDPAALGRVALAVGAFSLASSAVYIMNDLADRESDSRHPIKRLRPLASGAVTPGVARVAWALCLAGAAVLTMWLLALIASQPADPFRVWGGSTLLFALALAGYVALNALYSWRLRHVVLWDVFIIAAGFVLRALAGAFAVPVPISPWFYLCITFGALFLALGKRRAEVITLEGDAIHHRRNLRDYPLALLDQLMVIMVTCTLIAYSLYTFQGEYATQSLVLTIPVVLFGLFRYLYLVYARGDGAKPDEMLWRDRQLFAAIAVWLGLVVTLLYIVPALRQV